MVARPVANARHSKLHIGQCPECRAEVEAQHGLMNAMQTTPVVESMPHASLQKLWQRIESDPAVPAPDPARLRQSRLVGWLAAVVAAEALLLGVFTTVLYHSRGTGAAPAEFRTVTSSPATPVAPGVRAVFSPAPDAGRTAGIAVTGRIADCKRPH